MDTSRTAGEEMASAPCLYLRDSQIEKYLGESFDSLDVDDEITITVKARVSSMSKRKESEYSEDGKGEKKTRRCIDLELVERKTDGAVDKVLKELGKRARY